MKKVKEKAISIKFKLISIHINMLFDFVHVLCQGNTLILKGWFLLKKKKTCEIITKDFLVKRQE